VATAVNPTLPSSVLIGCGIDAGSPLPQHHSMPPLSIAQPCLLPTATTAKLPAVVTSGEALRSGSDRPNWLSRLSPQQ
jgi:hypothetical protein